MIIDLFLKQEGVRALLARKQLAKFASPSEKVIVLSRILKYLLNSLNT